MFLYIYACYEAINRIKVITVRKRVSTIPNKSTTSLSLVGKTYTMWSSCMINILCFSILVQHAYCIKSSLKPDCSDPKPVDCADIFRSGKTISGVYSIWPSNRILDGRAIEVFCDMYTDGGGWTVFQRRGNFSRSIDFFFKDWNSYKMGFGDIRKDFWLGNDYIFALTNQRLYSIRFDLRDVAGRKAYALYDTFWTDDENNKYKLHIQDYSGNAGDSMLVQHNNMYFTTKDRHNDNHNENCALLHKGGWWYNSCHHSNLNGLDYRGFHESYADGVNWLTFRGYHESLDTTEMKIRPKNF